MNFESRITWDKLALELELLIAEDPNSLLPLLIGLNSVVWPSENIESCFRTINFMGYELHSKCENYSEVDRIQILNDYFFDQKGFTLLPLNGSELKANHLLIKPVLDSKAGSPLTVSLIYLHLAGHLDLPIYLAHLKDYCLLKWVRGGKSSYLDPLRAGQIMEENQLLPLLNPAVTPAAELDHLLEILPNRKIFNRYLLELIRLYQRDGAEAELLTCYNIWLKTEPTNTKALAQRALLLKKMGSSKEALADLKRFFSFVDRDQSSPELQMAFHDLERASAQQSIPRIELLH